MQISDVEIKSFHFSGDPKTIASDLKDFLSELKTLHSEKSEFQLVHAIILDKEMHDHDVQVFNNDLCEIYKSTGFNVLGGDTSSGFELGLFISTIIF